MGLRGNCKALQPPARSLSQGCHSPAEGAWEQLGDPYDLGALEAELVVPPLLCVKADEAASQPALDRCTLSIAIV